MIRKSVLSKLRMTIFTVLAAGLLVMPGCGKRVEAVITTDGEDITDAAKQYETLAAQTESYMYLVRRYDVLLQMFPSNLVARLLKKKCLGVWKNEK